MEKLTRIRNRDKCQNLFRDFVDVVVVAGFLNAFNIRLFKKEVNLYWSNELVSGEINEKKGKKLGKYLFKIFEKKKLIK